MPTRIWKAQRRQVMFWLRRGEYCRFAAACKREKKDMAEVLRETVLMMIGTDRREA